MARRTSGGPDHETSSYSGYRLGKAGRVTARNNTIEDRPDNDPNIRARRAKR